MESIVIEPVEKRPDPLTYDLVHDKAATAQELLANDSSEVTRKLVQHALEKDNIPSTAKFVFGMANGAAAEDYCEVEDEKGQVLARYIIHENNK